tara:strand:+ start:166472 stop:167026 length:555 start_codon:yes stop_codon:yes gene_type:complete
MINAVWNFVKNPIYLPYSEITLQEKKSIFIKLLILNISFSFGLGLLLGIVTSFLEVDLGNHGLDELFKKYNLYLVFLLAVIVAPILEELLFRGPLLLFKNSKFFKYAFYASALLFGAIHLTNFESYANFLWLAPILVAPQTVAGVFLGFARVKLGLLWSILLHACHNGILLTPFLLSNLIGATL